MIVNETTPPIWKIKWHRIIHIVHTTRQSKQLLKIKQLNLNLWILGCISKKVSYNSVSWALDAEDIMLHYVYWIVLRISIQKMWLYDIGSLLFQAGQIDIIKHNLKKKEEKLSFFNFNSNNLLKIISLSFNVCFTFY